MEVYLTTYDVNEARERFKHEQHCMKFNEETFYDASFPERSPGFPPPPSYWADYCAQMDREQEEWEKLFQEFKKTNPGAIDILEAQAELHGLENVEEVVDLAMRRIFNQSRTYH